MLTERVGQVKIVMPWLPRHLKDALANSSVEWTCKCFIYTVTQYVLYPQSGVGARPLV